MPRKKSQDIRDKAVREFEARGGVLRTSETIAAGIHPRILYELRANGQIQQIARGVYALPGLPGIGQPDLATVSKLVPTGVICLVSALYFHELTVQIPKWVDVAIPQGYHPPAIDYPPAQFHWFSDSVFRAGIEQHDIGGPTINIYSAEKSIVDCFRLRRKVGIGVAIESLRTYLMRRGADVDLLRYLAKESRVLGTMTPYIESVLHDQS